MLLRRDRDAVAHARDAPVMHFWVLAAPVQPGRDTYIGLVRLRFNNNKYKFANYFKCNRMFK